jgi:hypothetical protein
MFNTFTLLNNNKESLTNSEIVFGHYIDSLLSIGCELKEYNLEELVSEDIMKSLETFFYNKVDTLKH